MSLINQALRKAQRDRMPNRMETPGQATASSGNAHASGIKPGFVVGIIATFALLIGLTVGLSVVLFKDSATSADTQTQPAPTVPTATAATPPSYDPAPATVADSADSGPDVIEELRAARVATEAKANAEAEAAAEAARVAAIPPNQMTLNWLEQAQVSGVRISSSDSKVILNGKAYSVGDFAHYGLGLKVMSIEQDRIFFIDADGKRYMKQL